MNDPRSRKIAVVADSLLGPLLDELDRDGFGVVHEGLRDVLDQVGGCHRAPTSLPA